MTMQECILTKILNCESADLSLLEDINYDLDDIIDDLMENNDLSLNSIFREVFRAGARDLQEEYEMQKDEIKERILEALEEEKEECIKSGEMTEKELEELEEHKELVNDLELLENEELNPEEDLDYFINYMDTHVFMKNLEFYRRWMEKEVDSIEYKMGWNFRDAA